MSNLTYRAMTVRPRLTVAIVFVSGFLSVGVPPAVQPGGAQERARLNKVIEALEGGRQAIADQEWRSSTWNTRRSRANDSKQYWPRWTTTGTQAVA